MLVLTPATLSCIARWNEGTTVWWHYCWQREPTFDYRTDLDGSVFDAVPLSGDERDRILALLAEHGVVPDVEQ